MTTSAVSAELQECWKPPFMLMADAPSPAVMKPISPEAGAEQEQQRLFADGVR